MGPIFLENNLEKLTNSLNLLITKEAKCLAAVDEDDEDEEETDAKVWDPIAHHPSHGQDPPKLLQTSVHATAGRSVRVLEPRKRHLRQPMSSRPPSRLFQIRPRPSRPRPRQTHDLVAQDPVTRR